MGLLQMLSVYIVNIKKTMGRGCSSHYMCSLMYMHTMA